MKYVRRLQAYIINHFPLIVTGLVFTILALIIFLAAWSMIARAESERIAASERAAAVEDILLSIGGVLEELELSADNIKQHQEDQTELIVCLLAIHGEETAISQADRERCELLITETEEMQEDRRESQREGNQTTVQFNSSGNGSNSGNGDGNNGNNNGNNGLNGIIQPIRDLFNGFFNG